MLPYSFMQLLSSLLFPHDMHGSNERERFLICTYSRVVVVVVALVLVVPSRVPPRDIFAYSRVRDQGDFLFVRTYFRTYSRTIL